MHFWHRRHVLLARVTDDGAGVITASASRPIPRPGRSIPSCPSRHSCRPKPRPARSNSSATASSDASDHSSPISDFRPHRRDRRLPRGSPPRHRAAEARGAIHAPCPSDRASTRQAHGPKLAEHGPDVGNPGGFASAKPPIPRTGAVLVPMPKSHLRARRGSADAGHRWFCTAATPSSSWHFRWPWFRCPRDAAEESCCRITATNCATTRPESSNPSTPRPGSTHRLRTRSRPLSAAAIRRSQAAPPARRRSQLATRVAMSSEGIS